MSATLISRNLDLAKLEAEGFRLRIVQKTASHLLVEGIPAVTPTREVKVGTLYCPLVVDRHGNTEKPCSNHQCWWIGEPPCDAAGRRMDEMISNPGQENKGDGIVTTVAFSRKRGDKAPYADYYEKIWTYVQLIWHEAQAIVPSCDPRSERPVPAVIEANTRIFRYPDMATTRAGIGAATARLLTDRIAIVGLGGTGSYILDLLFKAPISEIHLYDGDRYCLHNAYRGPGAPAAEDLVEPMKVDWFGNIADRMHSGIKRHPYYLTADNLSELEGFSFVFVAVDNAVARQVILEGLIKMKVPFIDVGMDIALDATGALRGMCRVTLATPECHKHLSEVVSYSNAPDEDDVYRNIQVADLNMMNAAMAVTRWKRLRGFYADDVHEHHSTYTTATHGLTKEDKQ